MHVHVKWNVRMKKNTNLQEKWTKWSNVSGAWTTLNHIETISKIECERMMKNQSHAIDTMRLICYNATVP